MAEDNYSMSRSRTQIATAYAPESFFTFEGGMGACIARSSARDQAPISKSLEDQIVDTINARVLSWHNQALNCTRTGGQPLVNPEQTLDKRLYHGEGRPRLGGNKIRFIVPNTMAYEPEPLTFVCRDCSMIKDFKNVSDFEKNQHTLCEGCPKAAKGEACSGKGWEQLDVVLVHWSGSYHRVTTLKNSWRDGEVKWSRSRCLCGNPHFRLDRSAPVFSRWRLRCTVCDSASQLPVIKDEETLRLLGDGIVNGQNRPIEVNMEPISYRANNAYYVQGDRILAFSEGKYLQQLYVGHEAELTRSLAKDYGYPGRSLSDEELQTILTNQAMETEWQDYKNHAEMALIMTQMGRQEMVASSLKAQQDLLRKWQEDDKILPPSYEPTSQLLQAVERRTEWERKFDPIRQWAEHKTLHEEILKDGEKSINVRTELKDPILPDLSNEQVEQTKKAVAKLLDLLGIDDMRLIRQFPVCEFTFGYTRVESGPRVERKKANDTWEMPVRLKLFPLTYFHEEYVQPIYVMRQDNEAFYVRLKDEYVRAWLDENHIKYDLPDANSKLGAALIDAYGSLRDGNGFSGWLDEYRNKVTPESRNVCAYVYTLLHTMAHQFMHAVAAISGLELGSMAEHIFLPDLAFVVYRRGTTMDLGYLSSAWRTATSPMSGNLILKTMLDPASLRCGSGILCDERGGACPDCILIPEICCLTRNNLLSRSVLRGMAKPHWDETPGHVTGFFEVVRTAQAGATVPEAAVPGSQAA